MGLSKNRKGSGIILAGAVVVPAAMNLTSQGIVSANSGCSVNQTPERSLLRKIFENKWGKAGVLTFGVLFLIVAFVLVSKSKGQEVDDDIIYEYEENQENDQQENKEEEPANKVTLDGVYDLMAPEDQALYEFMTSYSRHGTGASLVGDILYLNEENDSICYKWIHPYYLSESAYHYLVAMQKNVQEGRKIVPLKNWAGTKEDSYLYDDHIKGKGICAYIDRYSKKIHILDEKCREKIENKVKSKEEDFGYLQVADYVVV